MSRFDDLVTERATLWESSKGILDTALLASRQDLLVFGMLGLNLLIDVVYAFIDPRITYS